MKISYSLHLSKNDIKDAVEFYLDEKGLIPYGIDEFVLHESEGNYILIGISKENEEGYEKEYEDAMKRVV